MLSEGGPSLGEINDVRWLIYKATAAGEPDGDNIDSVYKAGYAANCPAGQYIALVTLDNTIERKVPFEVKDGEVAKPFINFEAGLVTYEGDVAPKDLPATVKAAERTEVKAE